MNRAQSFLATLSVLALCTPALAQDTEQATEQPAQTSEQPAQTNEVLDMGEPAADGPQLGERYSKE